MHVCVCYGLLACLRFTCCTECVHRIYILFVQTLVVSHLVFTLEKNMAAREVGGQRTKKFKKSKDECRVRVGVEGVQVMHL